MGKQWKQWHFLFVGSKIIAVGDCSHEIKRCLLLGRKVMTKLDSILKSRDITLPTKVCLVKAMVFPVVMYGCESWTTKRLNAEELMLLNCGVGEDFWESLDCKEIQPVHPKENQSWVFIGRNLMWRADSFEKTLMLGKIEGRRKRRQLRWLREWDGWMASLTQCTWVWASSRSWWWTGKPGVLQSMGSRRVRHNLATQQQHISWTLSHHGSL